MARTTRRNSTAVLVLRPPRAPHAKPEVAAPPAPPKDVAQLLALALRGYDWTLLALVGGLVALGLIMVYSASYSWAYAIYGRSEFFLLRQVLWLLVGLVGMVIAMRVPYRFWQTKAIPVLGIALVLLVASLFVGKTPFGAAQAVFRTGSVQPSEFAKIALIVYHAAWLASKHDRLREVWSGLIPYAVILAVVDGLIIVQPDFGTATLVVLVSVLMFFIAGAAIKQLVVSSATCAVTLALLISNSTHAMQRVNDFLATLKDPLSGGSYQVQLAVRALAAGGFLGEGIGQSQLKQPGGVPLPWSDTIFAILGNEMGLLGTMLVLGLFAAFAWRGLAIAARARDRFGTLLAAGLTGWMTLQAMINIAVVTATAPLTGLTLPFISYGGSSLVACLVGVGILLNISKVSKEKFVDDAPVRFGRWNRGARLSGADGDSDTAPSARRQEFHIPNSWRNRRW